MARQRFEQHYESLDPVTPRKQMEPRRNESLGTMGRAQSAAVCARNLIPPAYLLRDPMLGP